MLNDKKLFAVSAVFDNPDKLLAVTKTVSKEGFTKYDVNTPYPLHGMDAAMKLKPSKLGYVTLAFGLTGTATALLLAYWTMSVDYPMIIGGKPFFALPAFIPVTFELTVLLATLATVIGMLSVFFRLPFTSHPLHDTEYMRNVSSDKYGIYVEVNDNKYNAENVRKIFSDAGALRIDEIFLPVREYYPVFQTKFIGFLIVVFIATCLITYFSLNKLVYMAPFDWMERQDKLTPQESSTYFADGFGMRQPVKGTIAKGFIPYPYMGMPAPADSLVNPTIPTKQNLALGKKKYLTFCSPCHGNFADGDSRLRGQFVNPPTLHSTRARAFNDGMLYHIITNGQNTMPSYAHQVTREERWAIVNYLRVLQRAKNASPEDLQAVKNQQVKNGK